MRRHLLGIIGLLLLGAYLFLMVFYAEGNRGRVYFYASVCLRSGLVLGALWLALPQLRTLKKNRVWWTIGLIAAIGLAAMAPKAIPILLVIIAAVLVLQFIGWVFKPLPKSSHTTRSPRNESGKESNSTSG